MTGRYLPILGPLLADIIRPLYEFRTRGLAMLNHDHNASVELLLRVCDIRKAGSFAGNYVLNCNSCLVSFEYWMTARVFPDWYKIFKNKEVGHIPGAD